MIVKPQQTASLQQSRRADFRITHHYYPFLKNWKEHRANLDYLDNKSIGLLTASAILIAAFLVTIGQSKSLVGDEWSYLVSLPAIGGTFLLLYAVTCTLRCLRTLVDEPKPDLQKRLREMEECLTAGEWRQREAGIDNILRELNMMSGAVGSRRAEFRRRAAFLFEELSTNHLQFDEFESLVRENFNEIRQDLEEEVEDRHGFLRSAAEAIIWSVFLFGSILFVLLGKAFVSLL